MTNLRKDAINLIEQVPEEKLYFVVQLLSGINGLYADEEQKSKEIFEKKRLAFAELEKLRRKIPDLDYEKELAESREERYGTG